MLAFIVFDTLVRVELLERLGTPLGAWALKIISYRCALVGRIGYEM
jgi:hypothetical protein